MNDNIFIDKFEKKTNSELEYILVNRVNYTDDAISATIQILKTRNVISDLVSLAEEELKTRLENTVTTESFTKTEEPSTDPIILPELYSKHVVFAFSIIFSTLFGAILLMLNMNKIKSKPGRNQVLLFGILYTLISVMVTNIGAIGQNFSIVFNITGGCILTEYFWNTFIGRNLAYTKKSWVTPAIISLLITLPLAFWIFNMHPELLNK